MVRISVLLCWAFIFFACGDNKKSGTQDTAAFNYEQLAGSFPKANVTYQLTDAQLLLVSEAANAASASISGFIPDSLKTLLGTPKAKYIPVARVEKPKAETYFIVKGVNGSKKAAFLLVFDKDGNYAAALPFLVPDTDPTTSQTSSIDKSYSITRSVLRKKGIDLVGEGKDVFVYDAATKQFSWVVTDQLDENKDVLNPIDTLPATYKLSGDYVKDKKNIVSIRDGRYPNQLVLFVHFENGECKGELKGNLIITSSTSAVYRQSGDPCVLQLKFTGSTVTLTEEQGCANYRGIDCAFTGSFSKKKLKSASRTSGKIK